MNADSFDDLSRTIALGGTRRTVLKILGAAVIGYAIEFAGIGWRGPRRLRAADGCDDGDEDCSEPDPPQQQPQSDCGGRCTTGQICCRFHCVASCNPGDRLDPNSCQCISPCGFCPACERCQCDSLGCRCVPKENCLNCCNYGPQAGICQQCGAGQTFDRNRCQCTSTQSGGCEPACGENQICCRNQCFNKPGPCETFDTRSCRYSNKCGHPCNPCQTCGVIDPATGTCGCIRNQARCNKDCCQPAGIQIVCCNHPSGICPTCSGGEVLTSCNGTCTCLRRGASCP